ncbi:serine/threonine-protein phosphatase 7 long form homolog isoform X2 [Malania oleifera]|nr:serine/threonine-protein phosphatase 7 long form homolog isoform X2 [Malania oleifera]
MGEEHRSSRAWAEGHAEPLYCRGGTQYLKRLFDADDRIVRWIRDAGFYGIYRIAHIQLDWHLVTAFVERWRPETHTFHLPHGEATITLEDVAVLFGLPIDGKPVTGRTAGPVDGPADHQGGLALRRMCERLLGVVPPDSELQGARIRMRYLEAQFRQLRADADAETVARYARAHILRLICGMLFCDLSGNFAHLMFLPLLEDPTQTRSYSWGSATLAWLYREMCRAAHLSRREISGPLRLLQIWAWERCPSLAPSRLGVLQIERDEDGRPVDPVPLAYRWRDEMRALSVAQHTLPWYRFELDMHREHEFIWRPYTDDIIADLPTDYAVGSDLWVARVPLVCFHIIEWYLPDRVLRQFGYRQGIPDPFLTSGVDVHGQDLHNIDGRGRGVTNWTIVHDMYVTAWEHRREHIIPVKAEDGPLRSDDPYFSWYRSITRRFLNRTAGVYMSLADILHEVDLISPDPRVQNLVRAGLELVHDNGRQTHIPRPNPTARGGRAALVRGVRAAPVRAVHAPRASRRPLSHAGEPPVVQSEYVFGSSASYAYSPGADVAGPSSRHPDAPSVSYQLDDIVDAEDVDAPAMPPHSRPDSLCESSPHPLHMDADYAVPLGRDDRHTGRRRDRTPDADDQEGEDKRRRQPP